MEDYDDYDDSKPEIKLDLKKLARAPNIAEMLDDDELSSIGNKVFEEWMMDVNSRSEWEEKTSVAMKLALQVMEEKTFPWPNASNVKFPIVTLAALQYQARAYPALIPTPNVVKCRTVGDDPDGSRAKRAQRVSEYMSYQVLEEDECWEEHMDKVLISQAIVGCAFKKSYFDPVLKHNVSEHVPAKDLYIPYFARSLSDASRITHVICMSKNDLVEKHRLGIYLEHKGMSGDYSTSVLEDTKQEAQGIRPAFNDPSADYEFLEQHRWLDLDGDGYEEPYIVTVCKSTKQVVRIVARFFTDGIKVNKKGQIVSITPQHFFTKYSFIPSPDGGIYDLGFGVLLGPLNQAIDTILNQLVDAGTLSNTAGGFLGRGVKFRSGENSFRPFEWKRVDSTGDDLRKGIFPLPVREPSPVLFQLLSLLIDYGERIGMATDPMVGVNPGQNTPAETSRNMLAQGQKVFSAVFKRTYRGLKEEFRKLYALNGLYLNDETEFFFNQDGSKVVLRSDFSDEGKKFIIPAADPDMVTDEQRVNQAMMLKSAAMANPQAYNMLEVEKIYLTSIKMPNIEQVLNLNPPPPQPDTKVIIEQMKIQQKNMEFKMNMQLKMFDLMQEIEYLRAEILEKESRAALNYAQADGVESGQQIAAMQQAVALMKQKQDGLIQSLQLLRDLTKEEKSETMDMAKSIEGINQ